MAAFGRFTLGKHTQCLPTLFDFFTPNVSVFSTQAPEKNANESYEDENFRTINLGKRSEKTKKIKRKQNVQILPPRYTKLPVSKSWMNVWPAARTFNPSVVPFPVRQGYTEKTAPPSKFGNAELMKIPNFLHLTPPAIKSHCSAIKKFCTPWPEGLETDELCEKHFPIEIVSNDYCHSGPTIRDFRSRVISLKVSLKSLTLDYHAKDKLKRLVGERYDSDSDTLTFVVDRCPLKKQNYDYAYYLLTAVFHESWKTEPWESEKTEDDMEKYLWANNKSYLAIKDLIYKLKELEKNKALSEKEAFSWLKCVQDCSSEMLSAVETVASYAKAVTSIHNNGEDEHVLNEYKESVKALVGLHLKSDATIQTDLPKKAK